MRLYQVVAVCVLFIAVFGHLQAQPTIQQQPSSQLNQPLGTDVTLCVTAQSSNPPTLQYQWLRNGVLITSATNSCVTIDDIQATNCGAFSVRVFDDTGIVVSDPADVTVSGVSFLAGSDTLAGAVSLSQTNSPIRSSNTNAVKEAGTPDIIPGDPGGSEIWFSWSMPQGAANGLAVFTTLGSDFDTTLGVYIGSSPGNLAQVQTAINDDDTAGYLNSRVSFYAETGNTYMIAVDGFHGATGNVVLSWTFTAGAASLPSTEATPLAIVVANGSSLLLNVPWSGGANCDWFQNGQAVSSQGGVLLINSVDDDTVGSYVASLDNSDDITDLSEPTLVQINTLQDGTTSTNSIAWVKFLETANNTFLQPGGGKGHAIKLGGGDTAGFSCSQVFTTTGNVDEPGEPLVCNQNGAHPSWYVYVTPSAGSLLIDTVGSTFNTILGVFVGPGTGFATLTNIGCGYTTNYTNNGQPSVYLPNLPAGRTNYIVIEGENAAVGIVHLNIYLGTILLSIAPTEGGATLSWPAAGGTNLEVSTNPANGWQPATLAISTTGNTNSATATFGSGSQFFRLMEPPSVFK
jgi:hypothetical protein